MRTILPAVFVSLRRCLLAVFFLATALPGRAVIVDLNSDGVSDIWALKYGVSSFSATADSDGDGIKDAAEAVAGTDPFSANSTIKITGIVLDGTGLHFTFPTLLGKGYVLQKSASLATPVWTVANALVMGNGGDLMVTIPAAGATQYFYRVAVQDVDSDGDGVNDWEEITLGFDPKNSHSNGLSGSDDLTAITQALSAVNVVTVTATDASATEPLAGPALDTGTFQIKRTGNLNAITVNYAMSGTAVAGADYAPVTGSVTLPLGVNTATVTITPLADAALESSESAILTISPAAGYTVGAPAAAAVLINDAQAATGTGVQARFWNNTNVTIPVFTNTSGTINLNSTTPVLTRIDANINNTWGAASPGAGVNADYFVSRFTAEVLPEFSQIYTFQIEVERGGRLWVNGQLVVSDWAPSPGVSPTAGTYTGTIELVGGRHYPLVFEHMARSGNATAILSWQSANQPLQVIPQNRLFPTAPPQITSGLELLVIKDSPQSTYQIVASGEPTGYSAANYPAAWSFNGTTGVLTIVPTVAGVFPVVLNATNAQGTGSAILTVTVIATGGGITRDVWSGTYANVAALPLTTAPTSTALVTALEGPQNPGGGDYGARLRGYITAPVTGTYQFWLAAADAAELWIADDDEPINLLQRTLTTGPTTYRGWADATAGKSPLLWLKAGSRYYVEVRHADVGANGHVSVGWLKPGQTGTVPSEVVPAYALSPYTAPTVVPGVSTLFAANLTPQGAALSGGSGFATLQLSADEKEAILTRNFSNLTSPLTGEHIHDGTLPVTSNIVFDIDQATPRPDGSFVWTIVDVPGIGRTAAQLVQDLKAGQMYVNLHTATYPSGEIKGYLTLQAASQTFTAPALQTWTDPASAADTSSALNANGASRFLAQATFGPSSADITLVQSLGFEGWIDDQFTKAATHHRDYVELNKNITNPNSPTYYTDLSINSWWKNSITAPDQLRQRIAFALSEIVVISSSGGLEDESHGLTAYYDTLLDNGFGNFGTLLKAVTLTPTMGVYLDMRHNDKPNLASGLHPNENYAREIQQLFSIGLNRMFPDGTLMLNSKGQVIPTYDQDVITGFAHVFTGWDWNQFDPAAPPAILPANFAPSSNYVLPMTEIPAHHFTGQKRLLNNVVLPGLPTLPSLANAVLDPYATHTTAQIQTPEYQALPALELTATHNAILNHPNTAPFICRQLIQRLVTSTPSRGYVYRVVQAFNGERTVHGVVTGVRGDLREVVKAILLDYEARSNTPAAQQGYGKQREPVLRVTGLARAFRPQAALGGTYVQDGGAITVDTSPALHRLANGNAVALNFAGGTPATGGNYSVSGAFPLTTTAFTVRTRDIIRSNYSQAGTTVTVVSGNNGSVNHGLTTGDFAYLRFRDGAGKPADGVFGVTVTDATHFTVAVPTTATIATSNCDLADLTGEYQQTGTTVTFTCNTLHGLTSGTVSATFVVQTGQPTVPTLLAPGTITVMDATHFTVQATDSVARNGTFIAAPSAPALDRSGTVTTNFENWIVSNTDTALAQTPMRSPTVFNFFVPDFQFPGTLATAGLYTPEFQLTSDTNVMRQANFLFGGIFSSSSNTTVGNTNGVSSFNNGGGAITLDFLPWMGNGPGGVPWTNDVNLNALIDQLSTLLMAGHFDNTGTNTYAPTRVINNGRQAIYDYLTANYNGVMTGISVANPCVITCSLPHGLSTGQTVTITGVTGGTFNAPINGTFTATVTSSTKFSVPVQCTSTAGLVLTGANFTSTIQSRDRLRAIIHLLVTSPDFTIQK